MKKIKASQILIPTVYIMGIAVVALCLVAVGKEMKNYSNYYTIDNNNITDVFDEEDEYINENNIHDTTEELKETMGSTTIIKPYLNESVKLSKSYYDENADEKTQENSIIYYGNTYIQNMGSEYSSNNSFDILNVIDGTVSSVKQDSNLGYIVEIKHDNDLITVYQYLSEVKINEGTTILKGDVIGTSGKSIDSTVDEYTLHFEVYHKGKTINPETLYTMKVEDFE